MIQDHQERWRTLTALLEPIHERAQGAAHRLTGGPPDGDDLYHEAVLRAFDKLHTLRDATKFRSWFFAVLLSIHRTRHRRAFWKRFLSLGTITGKGADPVGEDGGAWESDRIRSRRLTSALERLPAAQREAVLLFEVEGFSIEEISEIQGATISAVKSRVARGRRRLHDLYVKRGWARGRFPEQRASAGEVSDPMSGSGAVESVEQVIS